MMEVDQISYIFGSFTRRRQSQDVAKRRSIVTNGVQNISHDRSNSAPYTSTSMTDKVETRTKSVYVSKQEGEKFECPICKKYYIEPRVLPCLHTFCTRCLQDMELKNSDVRSSEELNDCLNTSSNVHSISSGCDVANGLEVSDDGKGKNSLPCPICGTSSSLPAEGVLSLPPNYLLQHRIILATLNASSTHLLCDFCTADVSALFRCSECAVSLCQLCSDGHRRQRGYAQHEILTLEEARKKGIKRVQRLIMCNNHPEQELNLFCSTCCQVVCKECVSSFHKGHDYDLASRSAKSLTTNMKEALEKVRTMAKHAARISSRLQADSKKVQLRCNQIQEAVEKFMNAYLRSVEEHRKKLDNKINHAREEKLEAIEKNKVELHSSLSEIKNVLLFADELLNEGTDVEILSFIKPIFDKLERYQSSSAFTNLQVSAENLHFLPDEVIRYSDGACPLYGVVTTQTVSPKHCVLVNPEDLQNLRIGKKVNIRLEARDANNTPLERGGDNVHVDLRHRDAGISRSLLLHVEDLCNGIYDINFIPDVFGKLLLSVIVKGQPIQNSPFAVLVHNTKPHNGTFHCCSFCSSGGSKEAFCGCNGKMPGGYKGCGHGHEGHPGKRHWSCCGNVVEHSECVRANSLHYQFTL